MNAVRRIVVNPLGILAAIIVSHGFLPGISHAAERDSAAAEVNVMPVAPPAALIPGWKMPSGMGEVTVTRARPVAAAVDDGDRSRPGRAD